MPEDKADTATTASTVEEEEGDIFDAPENAVLIHACNCVGSWGAGIAKAFKTKYPAAYKVHNEYCMATSDKALIGTCQLIPPQEEDYEPAAITSMPPSKRRRVELSSSKSIPKESLSLRRHWIACLFTSIGYGKPTKNHPGMDKPDVILENTRKSLVDLKEQIFKFESKEEEEEEEKEVSTLRIAKAEGEMPGELWSCKFNSGLFAVDWADTRKVLEEELKGLGKTVRVVSPPNS